jgi:hypothetical protein
MTKSYRVCLILPEDNPHALCFREIGLLLLDALKSNGLDCDFTFNKMDQYKINIILGYHLLADSPDLRIYNYIPYQLEQLHSNEYPFTPNMENILRQAYMVWDYSEKNIAFLNEKGIEAKLLIPGYHEGLELIKPASNKSIDILFYGSIGERRKAVLKELSEMYKVKVLFGFYGVKRDKWISRSKIILNLHHYSPQIFEAVRISYLLNNRCFVLSEDSIDYPYNEVDLPLVPYENLVESCLQYLKSPEKIEAIKNENYESFKKHYPMTELVKRVL